MKRLNLKTYIGKQKAIEKMCVTITKRNRDTIVAYGDAGFTSVSKGQAPGPHQHFKKHLARYCQVIPVNEDYTSQMCSNCDCEDPMKGLRVPTGEGNQQRYELFKVRVCNRCRTVWNRDVNAARNIYHVFMEEVVNGQRPARFSRKTATTTLQVNGSENPIALQGPV